MNANASYIWFFIFTFIALKYDSSMSVAMKRPADEMDFTSDSVEEFLSYKRRAIAQQPEVAHANGSSSAPSRALMVPGNAAQLASLLVTVEEVRRLLTSKLPLSQLRSLLTGSFMAYHAIRQDYKVPQQSRISFFCDFTNSRNRPRISTLTR